MKHKLILPVVLAALAVLGLALAHGVGAGDLLARAWQSSGPPVKIDGAGALFSALDGAVASGGGFTLEPGSFPPNHLSQDDVDNIPVYWDTGPDHIGGPGIDNGTVYALAVDDDGNVYVGVDFAGAGGVAAANYIARWNSVDGWSALGSGVDGPVKAIAVAPNGDVYVGGEFTSPSSGIARWNGSSWSALRGGLNDTVNAIAVVPSGDVYVGGKFTSAGGASVNGIARWDGSSWHDVGGGVTDAFGDPGSVNALAVDGTGVYVGGNFAWAGDVDAAYVARWSNGDAGQWEELSSPLALEVDAVASNGTELYVASRTNLNGGFLFHQYTLADGEWRQLAKCADPESDSERIYAVAASQNNIFVGGRFSKIITDTDTVSANWVARWNSRDGTWSAMGGDVSGLTGLNDDVHALALHGPSLYAGGTFTAADSQTAGRLARWVQPIADLAVFGRLSPPGQVYAGQQLTYQVTLLHSGYHQATDVLLADELPDDVTFDSASDGGIYDAGTHTVRWTLASLAFDSRINRRVVAIVPGDTITGTILTNVASVTADEYDPLLTGPFLGSNTHTLETTVYAKAVLLLQKSAPATVDVGQELVYTLTVTNTGPSAASRVTLTDTLPSGVSFKTASPGPDWVNATLAWNLGAMPASGPDSVKTVSITVVPYVMGELENRARVSAPEAELVETAATTIVSGTIGLSVLKTDKVSEVGLNEPLTYTIVARVFGTPQVTGVRITDTLPVSVTLRSVAASQGSCSGTTTVICEPGTLLADEPVTVTLGVTPVAVGRLSNTAHVSGDGVDPTSSTDDDTWVKNEADLWLDMSGPGSVPAGQPFDYEITVVNDGPAATSDVILTDDLPDGLYLNAVTATQGMCTWGPDPVSAQVSCDIGALANGGSAVVTINVTPLVSGTFSNTATAESAKTDPESGNNERTVETAVVAGELQTRNLDDGLTISAYVFIDLGGGQTQAYGVVSLGEHFYLAGPNDYLTFSSSSLTGSGALALKVGELPIFGGDFGASAPAWDLTLGDGDPALPHLAGFTVGSSNLTGVNLLTGQVDGSTTELRLDPPGISVTVTATFTITPGVAEPVFSGTIPDAFTLMAGSFSLQVPAGATLSNAGVRAEPIRLVMPAYFGSGVVEGASLLVRPDSLRLGGTVGTSFDVPDLRFDNQNTLVIKNAEGVLVRMGDAYTIFMRDGELHLTLPGNSPVVPLGEVRLDSDGEIQAERLPAFTLEVAGATLTIDQALLTNPHLEVSQAVLQWPDNLGGGYGNVPDERITPDGVLTIAGGGEFALPDIEILGGDTLRVKQPVATLVEEPDGYALAVTGGALQVMLLQQNDHTLDLASGTVDVDGHFSGQLQENPLTLDVAAANLTLGGLSLDDNTGLSASQATWQLPTLGGGSRSFSAPIIVDNHGLHINDGNPVDFPDATLHTDGYPLLDNRVTLVQASDRTYKLDVSGTISVTIPGASSVVPARLTLDSLGNFNGSAGGLAMGVGGLMFEADGFNVQNGRPHILGARLAAPAEFGGDGIALDQMVVLDAATGLDFDGDGFAAEVNLPSLTALGANMFELAGSFKPVDRLPVGNPDGIDDGYEITGHGLLSIPSLGLEDDGKSKPSGGQGGNGISCSGIEVDIQLIVGESGNTILTVLPTSSALVPLPKPALGGPEYLVADDLSLRMIDANACLFCAIPLDGTGLQLDNLRAGFRLDRDLDVLLFRAGFTIETVMSVPVLNAPLAAGDVDATLQVMPDPQIDITGTLKIMGIFEAAQATAHIEPGDVRAQLVVRQYLWIGPFTWPVTGTLGFHAWIDWVSQAHFTGWGSLDMSVPKGTLVSECHGFAPFRVCLVLPPFDVPAPGVGVEFGEFRTDSSSVWGVKGEISVGSLTDVGVYIDADGTVDFGDVDDYVLLDSTHVLIGQQAWLRREGREEAAHNVCLPLVSRLDAHRGRPAATPGIGRYDLFTFAADTITRTVPVTTHTDMAFMLSRSSPVPTLTLVSPSGVGITPDTSLPGVVHWETYTQTVDIDDNIVPITQTTYIVKQAEAGDWQVVLHGDITEDDRYVLGVVGSNPLPTLSDVSAASTGPTSADVSWRLASEEIATLNIFATSGPITATYTVTHTDGTTETVARPVFTGLPVALDVDTPMNGALASAPLELSHLESGTYWIWVEAADQTNAPVRVYALDPIEVDNSASWPLEWTPNITVTPEYLGLHIAWDRLAHPDADAYRVHVSDSPLTGEPSLGHTTVITTQWLSTFVNTWLEPGRTHYVAIEAYDEDSGRTVRSSQVTSVPRAAEFELTTPTPAIAVTGGSAIAMDVLVTRTGDVTPTVGLYAGVLPDGLDVAFGSRWVTPTLAGTPVSLVISATDTLPDDVYTVTIVAFGGGASSTLEIHVTVNEPYFELVATPDTIALHENESGSVTVSAIGLNDESDPINLELEGAPPGLLWSLSSDVVYPGGSVTLVITDTFLVVHGKYDLQVVGDDGENKFDLVVPLDIIEPRFGLVAAQSQLAVAIGSTAVFTLEVTAEHGWTDPVTLRVDPLSLPPASTAGFAVTLDDLPQAQLSVTPPQTVYLILETEHTMPEDLYLLTVQAESGDRQVSLDLTLLAFAISDPPIVEAGSDQTVNEGDTVILDPAAFADPNIADLHTATVDWGDGTGVATGIVSELNGTGTISGTHVYADNGSYTVTVTVCDDHAACGEDSFIVTASNVAPTGRIDGAPAVSPVGTPINLTCTVSDPGSADTFTYAWTVTKDGNLYGSGDSSSFSFTPDDSGTYLVSLTVTDDDGGVSPVATVSIEAGNVPPDITSVTSSATEINEGDTITLVTTFVDPGADTHTAAINWGDGDSDTLNLAFGARVFTVTHQYLDDNPTGTPSDVYNISLRITDDDGGTGHASTTVTVNNVDPVVSIDSITDEIGTEIGHDVPVALTGLAVELKGSFTDVGTLDTHTARVRWGDGTATGLGRVRGTMRASHIYANPGKYRIRLFVTDDDLGVGTATVQIRVVDATGAIVAAIDDLITLAANPNLDPAAAAAIEDALDKLRGSNGGRGKNGALDMLEKGNLNAALEKIKQALQDLEAAEAADPSLDLTNIKGLLALAAKSVAVKAIEQAEAAAAKPKDLDKIRQAKNLVAQGDRLLAVYDHVGAVSKYQEAVQEVQGIH